MYCGKKSEMGERMRQLRLVYNTAKREEMNRLNEILGQDILADTQSGTTSDAESMDNVQVSTPAMSTSGESDISEGFENNKGDLLNIFLMTNSCPFQFILNYSIFCLFTMLV